MCIGERIHTVRFGGKVFGQVQGDAAAVQDLSLALLFSLLLTLLSVLSITFFFSPMLSHCRVVSFPRSFVPSYFSVSPSQGEAFLSLSLSLSAPSRLRSCAVGAARFVSFFVSGDKPTVRSRRSRRPTAYTRTRQLLRTTRHIVSALLRPLLPSSDPVLFPLSFSLSYSLSRSSALRSARHVARCISAPRCDSDARGGGF